MMNFLYSRHSLNIMTIMLSALALIVPAVLIGTDFVAISILMVIITALGGGAFTLQPEMIPGVTRIRRFQAPELHGMIDTLSDKAGLSQAPDIYLSESSLPNGAAILGAHGHSIIITSGLLSRLRPLELESVLAHEIMHIKNGDLLLLDFLARFRMILGGIPKMLLMLLALLPLLLLFAPITSLLATFFVSYIVMFLLERAIMRLRELGADYGAIRISSDPFALSRALRTLENVGESYSRPGPMRTSVQQDRNLLWSLLRSHPSTDSRIAFMHRSLQSFRPVGQGFL